MLEKIFVVHNKQSTNKAYERRRIFNVKTGVICNFKFLPLGFEGVIVETMSLFLLT